VHVFDLRDLRILGVDLAQTIEILALPGHIAALFCVSRQSGEGFGLIGIHQQDLMPVLRGEVHATARLKRPGFAQENFHSRRLRNEQQSHE
jgi:hypothetical protein